MRTVYVKRSKISTEAIKQGAYKHGWYVRTETGDGIQYDGPWNNFDAAERRKRELERGEE